MKINEVLDFPPGDGEFELLNLDDAIDIELFKDILKDNNYTLTFNAVDLNEAYDRIMKPFAAEINAKTHYGNWKATVKAYYNWNIMCLYFQEEYQPDQVRGGVANSTSEEDDVDVITVYVQISYTNTRMKNRIDFLDEATFKKRTSDPWELIDLNKLHDIVWNTP